MQSSPLSGIPQSIPFAEGQPRMLIKYLRPEAFQNSMSRSFQFSTSSQAPKTYIPWLPMSDLSFWWGPLAWGRRCWSMQYAQKLEPTCSTCHLTTCWANTLPRMEHGCWCTLFLRSRALNFEVSFWAANNSRVGFALWGLPVYLVDEMSGPELVTSPQ